MYGGNVRALCFALRRGVRWFVISIWIISVVGVSACGHAPYVHTPARSFLRSVSVHICSLACRISLNIIAPHRPMFIIRSITHPHVSCRPCQPRALWLCVIHAPHYAHKHTRNNVYRYVSLLQLNHLPSVARLSVLSLSYRLKYLAKRNLPEAYSA